MPSSLLSVDELAAYLGVPKATIYNWSHTGSGPTSIRVGRYLRFRVADVERWLDSQSKTPAA